MRKGARGLFRVFLVYLLPVLGIFVFGVCYFAFRRLVLPSDFVLSSGKKYSQILPEIRKKFLERGGVSAVSFKTKDGLKLSAYVVKRKKPLANMVVCHGYQSCKERALELVDMFTDYNMIIFDFRAHGQSEGRLRTLGCHEYKDVIAASQFLRDSTKTNKSLPGSLPMVILGFSMGGASALRAVKYEPNICDALILDSSFSRLNTVIYNAFSAKSGLPCYPFLPILKQMVNYVASCDVVDMCPIDSLKYFDKPVFFIHSCVDKIVQPADSLDMFANVRNEKSRIWIGPKCQHPKLHKKYAMVYKRKVEKFLKTALT